MQEKIFVGDTIESAYGFKNRSSLIAYSADVPNPNRYQTQMYQISKTANQEQVKYQMSLSHLPSL